MSLGSNSTGKDRESIGLDPRKQQRSLFAVTSIAVFLVALMLIYWPRAAEPVSVIIERTAPQDSDLQVIFSQNDADNLKSPSTIETAWQDVAGRMDGPTDLWLSTFSNELEVEVRASRRGDRSHLVAIYRGQDPAGLSVLNQLAENFVEYHKFEGSEEALDQKARADRAEEQAAAKARAAEERANVYYINQLKSAQEVSTQKTETTSKAVAVLAPVKNPTPLWTELSEKLKKLQVKRAEMLTRLHPVHPSVEQLDAQIEKINNSLSEISPSYPTTDPVSTQAAVLTSEPTSDQTDSITAPEPNKNAQLQEAYQQAALAHGRAKLAAKRAQLNLDRHKAIKLRVAAWAEREKPSMLLLLSLAVIVSLLAGFFVARGGTVLDSTIRLASDAEGLPAPVVGVLPATEASPRPIKIRPPLWCRGVMLAAQLTVVSFLFCFLLIAILDGGFILEVCKHPLSAFPTAIHKLPELISG